MLATMAIRVAVAAAAAVAARPDAGARTITVEGNAEVRVVPDQVVITLGVESIDKDLAKAKKDNDGRVRRVLAAVKAIGVEDRNVATDHISLEPRYESSSYAEAQGRPTHYAVRKTIVVTVRDIARFEGLLSDAIGSGANYVHGVDFQTTELRKHRDQARALALKAAREKAQAMAKEMSQKVGVPRTIAEHGSRWWSSYGWWGGRAGAISQNVVQNAGGPQPETEGTVPPGMISVTADVTVTFDLE